MSQSPVARRYAQALQEQAAEIGVLDRVDADMELLRQTLHDSRDLTLLFASPVVSRDRKKVVLKALFGERVHAVSMDLMMLLVDKRREAIVSDVVSAYRDRRDASRGVITATVRTARPLAQDDEQAITDRLAHVTGKTIRLEKEVDASLMGGVIVHVGDTVYDGSVSNRLATLRERLSHGSSLN